MRFISKGIGDILTAKLSQSSGVQIASAFFSPSKPMLNALSAIPRLTLVISEEFTINNPYMLERLHKATLRSVPPDHDDGKLHAKVFIATLKDGFFWALVGSANLTQQGLFANQEACIELHSSSEQDIVAINEIRGWFQDLFAIARKTDLAEAKKVYDLRSRYRLEPRSSKEEQNEVAYWAIKTTSGGADAEDHWDMLRDESVVAVGWEEIGVNPSKVSDERLSKALLKAFPHYTTRLLQYSIRILRYFIDMPEGSIILLCRGYSSNQKKAVHIYAFARITGPFRADPVDGTKWRFKRDAVIQQIDIALPKDAVATALDKGTLRQTMHKLSEESFNALADLIAVPVEV